MFCTTCGARLEDGTLFCTSCGTRVEDAPQPVSEAEVLESIDDIEAAVETGIHEPDAASQEQAISFDEQRIAEAQNVGAEQAFVEQAFVEQAFVEQHVAQEQMAGSVIGLEAHTMPPTANNDGYPGQQPAWPLQESLQQPVQKKSHKGLIIGIVAAVVVIGAILVYAFAIAPVLKANKTYDVEIITTGSALESSMTTPALFDVKGTVLSDGSTYDEDYSVQGTETVKLHEGDYAAMIVGPLLTADGQIVQFSPAMQSFRVSEESGSQQLLFTASVVNPDDMTQAMIDQARSTALLAGENESLVQSYADAAESNLAAAQAKKQKAIAAEAERLKAEEDAKAHTSGATWYVCASDFVTLRVNPSTSARAITRINSREPVTYLGDAGSGWVKIRYGSQEGYVLSRFVSYDKNAPLDYGDV